MLGFAAIHFLITMLLRREYSHTHLYSRQFALDIFLLHDDLLFQWLTMPPMDRYFTSKILACQKFMSGLKPPITLPPKAKRIMAMWLKNWTFFQVPIFHENSHIVILTGTEMAIQDAPKTSGNHVHGFISITVISSNTLTEFW